MLRFKVRAATAVVLTLVVPALLTMGGAAFAAGGIKLCVPKKEGSPILTPKHGKCRKGYKRTTLGAEGKEGREGKAGPEGKAGTAGLTSTQLETLKGVLPFIKFVASGIAGKPTIQFSGVNVQVVSGAGKTNAAVNGAGNLVIGYDENPEGAHAQTGSHDLILGEDQTFTSFAGIVGGIGNSISGPFDWANGRGNTASGFASAITGGRGNTATAEGASVIGGDGNKAFGIGAWVGGGFSNTASNTDAAVSGGRENFATGVVASVSGGMQNGAEGEGSSIFGGKARTVEGEFEAGPSCVLPGKAGELC